MATNTKKKKKKKKSIAPIVITGGVLAALVIGVGAVYFTGKARYEGKFLPNTYINNIEVSGKTLEEVEKIFDHSETDGSFDITRQDGGVVSIPLSAVDYKYDTNEKLEELFSKQDPSAWFMGYAGKADLTFTDTSSFDKDKLKELLAAADWGSKKNENAKIVETDDGFVVEEAVQGDEMDYSQLETYLVGKFSQGIFTVNAKDSGCYIKPTVYAADLEEKCENLNKIYSLSITYDFDYTTETLTGDRLLDMISYDEEDFKIVADRDKCMKYVEELAEKYDTFDTERKFHATLQGDIIVPRSDDAKYGWWIYQDETCDQLVEMLEKGENVDSVKPIYFYDGEFEYTGVPEARTAEDDIGDTYGEVDLTAQHFWYYEKGELMYECDIVSGQTTSLARTTLPGVYKLWNKQTNYRMKATNADGESWDTTCNYWNNVSLCGIGLHDTVTRGNAFGGNIYKYAGSHGCINMPLDAAKYLYDNAPLGMPVVMYYKSADAEGGRDLSM